MYIADTDDSVSFRESLTPPSCLMNALSATESAYGKYQDHLLQAHHFGTFAMKRRACVPPSTHPGKGHSRQTTVRSGGKSPVSLSY
jgi:hypothetical protein